jgi:hypothetical protein
MAKTLNSGSVMALWRNSTGFGWIVISCLSVFWQRRNGICHQNMHLRHDLSPSTTIATLL